MFLIICNRIDLQDGPLKTFVGKTKGLTPEEAGKVLMDFEGIKEVHDDTASEGQTEVIYCIIFHVLQCLTVISADKTKLFVLNFYFLFC